MKNALALRHVPFEHLGILQPLLEARGYTVRTVDVGVEPVPADDVVDADLLIVLGGPIGAYDDATYPFVRDEAAAIAQRLAARKPLLGICLGAQLIARALGAAVKPMGSRPQAQAHRSRRWPTARRCCTGMATSTTYRPARNGWHSLKSAPSRLSPLATTHWGCNSIWRPTWTSLKPG